MLSEWRTNSNACCVFIHPIVVTNILKFIHTDFKFVHYDFRASISVQKPEIPPLHFFEHWRFTF